jgi:ketosteroid isomerase-like protein
MPWFPDFTSAVELARKQTQVAGHADPVAQYFDALNKGDTHVLETVWPGEVVIYDPRAGEVRGHREVRRFVSRNMSWLAGLHARTETVASTVVGSRAVVELLARLDHDGGELVWPVAVIAESPDDSSVVFRTYCSQWPVDEQRHVRPPILKPADIRPGDVVGRYQAAVAAGDVEAVLDTFAPDGYFRGPFGPRYAHRGPAELRSFFTWCFSAGGGIVLEDCAVTDDGVRCALEYNCVRWGDRDLPHQAGLGVYERGPDGLLTAVRIYDDVRAPIGPPERQADRHP